MSSNNDGILGRSSDCDDSSVNISTVKLSKASSCPTTTNKEILSTVEYSFSADDGIGRVDAALEVYECDRNFKKAIQLMEDAHSIFMRQVGANHARTRAALNYIMVIKAEQLKDLWEDAIKGL